MPQTSKAVPGKPGSGAAARPASTAVAPATSAASSGKKRADDAFSSLLPSFGSGTSEPLAAATGKSAAQPLTEPKRASVPDPWGLDAFERHTQKAPAAQPSAPAEAEDLLGELAVPPRQAASVHTPAPSHDLLSDMASPAPNVAASASADDDDLLGELARPVQRPAPSEAMSHSPASLPPPPHVVGQLVEMGFAPDKARYALSQTSSGTDIEHAVQLLTEWEPPAVYEETPVEPMDRENNAARRVSVGRLDHTSRHNMHRGRPTADVPAWARPGGAAAPPNWEQHADQLYARASELGANVFSRANAFWGSAKAHAQRALDEARMGDGANATTMRTAAQLGRHALRRWGTTAGGAQSRRPVEFNGKPRWMLESEEAERASAAQPAPTSQADARPAPKVAAQAPPKPVAQAPKPTQAPRSAAPVPRTLAPEDASAVAHATRLKDTGNAAFQRGAYAEAEQLYTQALDVLSPTSLWRVPLLNNRANVRLKNGNHEGTIADTTCVIELIVLPAMRETSPPMYRPSSDALPPSYSALNLREAYAKSIAQRARALETGEKWAMAKRDWELLSAYERAEGSGVRSGETHRRAAADGVARCDKMLRPPAPKPAPAKTQVSAADAEKAARAAEATAAQRMQALQKAQDAEETARMAHKDSVDARIAAWTAGKKDNVRALLASIDDPALQLVWPELRWKKVGLHELITDAQVKRAYARAIARLHPDKLSPSNTSVEQRLLAAGMFNALNEAYCQ